MAAARCDHAMAVLDGKLYAVGGFDGDRLSSVERYDPTANAWEAVAPMGDGNGSGRARSGGGGAQLYAVGGLNDDDTLSSVERHDAAANAWAVGVAVLDGKLYAVGGKNEDEEDEGVIRNTVEIFDPATNAWGEVSPMATARVCSLALL